MLRRFIYLSLVLVILTLSSCETVALYGRVGQELGKSFGTVEGQFSNDIGKDFYVLTTGIQAKNIDKFPKNETSKLQSVKYDNSRNQITVTFKYAPTSEIFSIPFRSDKRSDVITSLAAYEEGDLPTRAGIYSAEELIRVLDSYSVAMAKYRAFEGILKSSDGLTLYLPKEKEGTLLPGQDNAGFFDSVISSFNMRPVLVNFPNDGLFYNNLIVYMDKNYKKMTFQTRIQSLVDYYTDGGDPYGNAALGQTYFYYVDREGSRYIFMISKKNGLNLICFDDMWARNNFF